MLVMGLGELGSALDVEAAVAADDTNLIEDLLDEGLLPADPRQLGLEAPGDQRRQRHGADEVWRHPVLSSGSAGGGVGGPPRATIPTTASIPITDPGNAARLIAFARWVSAAERP